MEDHERGPATGRPFSLRSWPLFTVAALAFVPVAGILFGAIGLTWGLLSNRPRAITAALIAGAGALLNVGGLMTLGFFAAREQGLYSQAKVGATRNDLVALVHAIEAFHEENGAYPGSLTALQQRPAVLRTINIYDRTASALKPRPYRYEVAPDGDSYDLYSVGEDGEAGTPDDVRPVLADSVAARVGYRPRSAGTP